MMTLDARLPEEPGPWALERIAPGEHGLKLREFAAAADFTVLVAPETSGVLARLTRDLEGAGARVLGSCARAVDLAGDKVRLWLPSSIQGDRHACLGLGQFRAMKFARIYAHEYPGRSQAG